MRRRISSWLGAVVDRHDPDGFWRVTLALGAFVLIVWGDWWLSMMLRMIRMRRLAIAIAALALAVPVAAQSTVTSYDHGVFRAGETNPVAIVSIPLTALTCGPVTTPTLPAMTPILNPSTLVWDDGAGRECRTVVTPTVTAMVPATAPYTSKVRSVASTGSSDWGVATPNWYRGTALSALTCPGPIVTPEAQVIYPLPIPAGGIAPVAVSCTPPSGSTFATGTTTVGCTAVDTIGSSMACSFQVTVNTQPPPPGDTTAPAVAITNIRRSGNSANYNVTATAVDASGIARVQYLVDGQVQVTVLGPGTQTVRIQTAGSHLVEVWATDPTGNTGKASRTVVR